MIELALAVTPVAALSVNVLAQLQTGRTCGGSNFSRSVAAGFAAGLLVCIALATLLLHFTSFSTTEAVCRFAAALAAYFCLSFCYFNFLNLGHGSIRMRIFDQVSKKPEGLCWQDVVEQYDDRRLMDIRLRRLVDHRFIEQRGDRYFVRSKALLMLARTIRLAKRMITGRASQFEDPRGGARPAPSTASFARRTLDTPGVAAAVTAVHLLALVVGSWIAFSNHREMLFSSLDGVFERCQVRLQHTWMPDVFSYGANPLAAMGNIFGVFNTRIMPCFALSTLPFGGEINPVLAYTIVAVELFAAMLVLGVVFRLGTAWRFASAWAVTIYTLPYLWPPKFFHMSELDPHHIELLAASCLIVSCYRLVGKVSMLRSAVLTLIGLVLVVFMAGSQPQWFVVASVLLIVTVGVLTCASASRRELLVKLAAAATIVVVTLPTIAPFVAGGVLNSVPSFFRGELREARSDVVLTSILFHGVRYSTFGPTIWVMSALGAVLDLLNRRSPTRALAAAALASHAVILSGVIVTRVLMSNYQGPSYMYFEIFAWHFFAIYAIYFLGWGAAFAWRGWLVTLRWWNASWETGLRGWTAGATMVCSLALLLFPLYAVGRTYRTAGTSPYLWRSPAEETRLVSVLKQEIALSPAQTRFRGAAATFTGFQNTRSISWIKLYAYDAMLVERGFGNQHRMLGLWEHNIPTLFDYNYLVPPALYATATRLLSRPEDEQERNVIVLSRINAPYLASIGVRFVVTDFEVPKLELRQKVHSRACDVTHRLYELPHPNLGDYSPTELIQVEDASQALEQLQRRDFDFRRQAVVFEAAPTSLSPARSSRLDATPDGVVVTAASDGRSLLLLPLLYSHCLDLEVLETDRPSAVPRLLRANLTQAALLFSGNTRVRLRFRYGPFANQFGLLADYRELKRVKLQEVPDYHDNKPPRPIADLSGSVVLGGPIELPIKDVHCSSEDETASLLFDGDPSTCWSSELHERAVREKIIIELKHACQVRQVRWCCAPDAEHISPTEVELSVSSTGAGWSTVPAKDVVIEQHGRWTVARFPETPAQSIRMQARSRLEHAFYKVHMAEIAVEGLSPDQQLLELAWSAPSDVGEAGRSHEYEVRYSRRPIKTERDWRRSNVLRGLTPTPAQPGTTQTAWFMLPDNRGENSSSDSPRDSNDSAADELDVLLEVVERLRHDPDLQKVALGQADKQLIERAVREAVEALRAAPPEFSRRTEPIYFAIRSRDKAGNISPLSNCAQLPTEIARAAADRPRRSASTPR